VPSVTRCTAVHRSDRVNATHRRNSRIALAITARDAGESRRFLFRIRAVLAVADDGFQRTDIDCRRRQLVEIDVGACTVARSAMALEFLPVPRTAAP
jgi:hypothetical protein